ncbi:MAG: hypothetical protein NT150_16110 [Bacteroidetes bacterium]|nr:hypothetical protein [Bacteroidota bacterium]
MKNFRLPRKTKKSLKGEIWLYPRDKNGNSTMAFPCSKQEDYSAWKQGIKRNLMDEDDSKEKRKAYWQKLDKEISVSDKKLREYVDDIFREGLRNKAYQVLLDAKNEPKAIVAYYNFINAYQMQEEEPSGNICCLAFDKASELLKKERIRKMKKRQR